jgi:transcriptional regulator with XRE-family HTH domain
LHDQLLTAEALGKRLKQERQRLRLTQAQLGELAGVKRLSVYLYERGDRRPTMDFVVGTLAAGVSLEYLLLGEHRRIPARDRFVDVAAQSLTPRERRTGRAARSGGGKTMPSTRSSRCITALVLLLGASTTAAASTAYIQGYPAATCSAYFSHRAAHAEGPAKEAYAEKEKQVFALIAREFGRETAIHMTRAAWDTWSQLALFIRSDADWERVWAAQDRSCRRLLGQ